jgi:hypothetical protein
MRLLDLRFLWFCPTKKSKHKKRDFLRIGKVPPNSILYKLVQLQLSILFDACSNATVFVERSSAIECTHQPPPKKQELFINIICHSHTIVLSCALLSMYVCNICTYVIHKYSAQFCNPWTNHNNFLASLKHGANACSCFLTRFKRWRLTPPAVCNVPSDSMYIHAIEFEFKHQHQGAFILPQILQNYVHKIM